VRFIHRREAALSVCVGALAKRRRVLCCAERCLVRLAHHRCQRDLHSTSARQILAWHSAQRTDCLETMHWQSSPSASGLPDPRLDCQVRQVSRIRYSTKSPVGDAMAVIAASASAESFTPSHLCFRRLAVRLRGAIVSNSARLILWCRIDVSFQRVTRIDFCIPPPG